MTRFRNKKIARLRQQHKAKRKKSLLIIYHTLTVLSRGRHLWIVSSKNWQVFYHFFEQLEQIIFKTVRHH